MPEMAIPEVCPGLPAAVGPTWSGADRPHDATKEDTDA